MEHLRLTQKSIGNVRNRLVGTHELKIAMQTNVYFLSSSENALMALWVKATRGPLEMKRVTIYIHTYKESALSHTPIRIFLFVCI